MAPYAQHYPSRHPDASPPPGELTFSLNRRLVDAITLVSDDEIVAAMRFAFERLKIVLEPSGATALAALLAGRPDPPPIVVIARGNATPTVPTS
ncbi:pyridoxal-phosphate dependent enzyme [Streptomyces sp. DHE17-7]|uniref:pyridoxal-phosphate dependent enzyme n=1 Tax=Streptomyces sp. DHE17-7 TaxID=2759949 RepID=UPI003FA7EEBA